MTTRGRAIAAAAGILAAAILSAPATAAPGPAHCRIEPRVLDVQRPAGALIVRLELPGDRAAPAPGVFVSSVGGTPLPGPGVDAEGIDENPASRGRERPVHVIRFDRACDGDPATRDDGDAGDLLAMLLDRPDGEVVEICLSGRAGEEPFTCCDRVEVRNRGLRDLPRGLFPEGWP